MVVTKIQVEYIADGHLAQQSGVHGGAKGTEPPPQRPRLRLKIPILVKLAKVFPSDFHDKCTISGWQPSDSCRVVLEDAIAAIFEQKHRLLDSGVGLGMRSAVFHTDTLDIG